MKKFNPIIFLACGLLLTLAAFPVFAQNVQENKINSKPFQDFVSFISQEVSSGKVDLTKPFAIELEGILTKEGKLDAKKSKFTKSEGDAKMVGIAKDFIEAVNSSGLFGYLRNLGIEKIKFALVQDDSQIYGGIVSEQESAQRAMTVSSGFNTLLRMVSLMDESKQKRLSDEEKIFLQGVTANNEDKNLTLKFAYQKSVIHEMINRGLQELKQKKVK